MLKYQRLSKEEKKKAKNDFFQTERGKVLKIRFNRLIIYGIALIAFGIFLLVEAITKKDSYAEYIYSTIVIIFGISFLIGRFIVMRKQVNDYIVKKK